MKPSFNPQAEKELLEQALEEHLHHVYDMHTSMRSSDFENPTRLKPLLKTWYHLHKNHQRMQKQLKTLIYETQFPLFKPGALKKAPRRTRQTHEPGNQ